MPKNKLVQLKLKKNEQKHTWMIRQKGELLGMLVISFKVVCSDKKLEEKVIRDVESGLQSSLRFWQ